MSAVVLVGGLGTRLRPVTYEVPKQLIPIAGQSALFHVFDLLPPEVTHIVLACGYRSGDVSRFLKDHPYPVRQTVVIEETPLGTGGGMKNAASLATDPFLLLNSDVMTGLDVGAMLRQHLKEGPLGTMSLFEVEDTQPYGVAELGEHKRLVRFVEKPKPAQAPSHWINAGASVWAREVMDEIPEGRKVSFEQEVLPHLLGRGVYGYTFTSWWEDAGTPERLLHAQRLLFDNPQRRRTPWKAPEGTNIKAPVAVGKDSRLSTDHLGPYVTLGDGVVVEKDAHVEDSVIMDGVVVGRGSSIKGSIIGPGVRISADSRIENRCVAAGSHPGD